MTIFVRNSGGLRIPIGQFQNAQFKMAELATEVEIGQCFVDRLLAAHVESENIETEVSMAKWWASDL